MFNDINGWRVVDENPGIALDAIEPVSNRAASLIARNKGNPLLSSEFFRFQGVVEMMKGLDYHHDNFMKVIGQVAKAGLDGMTMESYLVLMHEATAYLNRFGQFHSFLESDFVETHLASAQSVAPTVFKYVIFRNKYSAHRSIDDPRKESAHVQATQAMSMSSIGGKIFEPKPGQNVSLLSVKTAEDFEAHVRNTWENCYLVFQLITDDPNVFFNFSIEKEHPIIMQEAYAVLKQVLGL